VPRRKRFNGGRLRSHRIPGFALDGGAYRLIAYYATGHEETIWAIARRRRRTCGS
jgi:hypothetical protein